jgi:putative DNA primase/helicase
MSSPDPFAPIGGSGAAAPAKAKAWSIVMPVPTDAPKPPAEHFKLGKPSGRWTYLDAASAVLGCVLRFDLGNGEKEFRPLTLWRPAKGGKIEWRWESWPPKRPLYGLRRLAERPSAPVVICEGEKAADAAARLLPGFVAVTAPNGAKSADKADWSPLQGRRVVIWPDADSAGLAFAGAAAKSIAAVGAESVVLITLPMGVAVGWDAADAEAAGWDERRAVDLVNSATPLSDTKRPRRPRRDERSNATLDALLHTDGFELWRDRSGATYATVPTASHFENWPLKLFAFERWLAGFCYRKSGAMPTTQELEDIRRILDIKAYSEGTSYEPAIRVGRGDDRLYLDLCDDEWRSVEISARGWQIVQRPPVKFLRSMSARALPEPVCGDMIERLRRYVNVESDDEFRLIVSWLVAALRPGLAFPILIVNGTHGSGKSVLCKMLRQLIDPDIALNYAAPGNERDLVLAAANSWVISFDNMSEVTGYLPDAVCRVSTGGGFRTRALHTNRDEAVFWVQRPVLMNGIPVLTEVGDFGSRAIVINLSSIPSERRQPEAELWHDFENDCARILGVLLDGAVRALQDIGRIKLSRSDRMPDFEKWAIAAAPAFGWTGEDFQSAYHSNRMAVADDTFEADVVAVAVNNHLAPKHPQRWEGSPAALQVEMDELTPEYLRKSKFWPKTPMMMGNALKRAKPLLEHKGFTVERRKSGTRSIIIVPPRTAEAADMESRRT